MRRHPKTALIGACLYLCLAGNTVSMAERPLRQDTTSLYFVSSETVRTYRKRPVRCLNYVVKEGDHVWKILRERGHRGREQLSYWTEALKALNPKLTDVDKIYPGQRLLIPLGFQEEGSIPEVVTTGYTVRPGDTMADILRRQLGLPDHLIFDEALTLVRRLNPEITDVNKIRAGQRIVLAVPPSAPPPGQPRKKAVLAGTAATAGETVGTLRPKMATPGAGGQEPSSALTVDLRPPRTTPAATVAEGRQGPVATKLAGRKSPEERRLQVLADALMAVVVGLGGRCRNAGQHFLPLPGQGQLSLAANSFPLLELPTGARIFLDIGDRLPVSLEEAVSTAWRGRYRVIDLVEGDNFRAGWQKVLRATPGIKQWSARAPLRLHQPVAIAIGGDWVMTAAASRDPGWQVLVVNLLRDGSERTDPALQTFLNNLGVRVVEVQLRGQLEPARISVPLDDRAFGGGKMTAIEAVQGREAVAAILELLGVRYQRDTDVAIDAAAAVRVAVRAPFVFAYGGRQYVIDFGMLSAPMRRLLGEHGYQVLIFQPHTGVEEATQRLAAALKLTLRQHPTFVASSRGQERNIRFDLPGILLESQSGSYLVTQFPVSPSLADYLYRQRIKILVYRASSP